MDTFERAAELLGGKRVLGAIPSDPLAAAEMIRLGLPSRTLESLRTRLNTNLDELAAALSIPKRTLERRLEGTASQMRARRLSGIESERVYRFARVTARAVEALGDLDKAFGWLRKENRALGGKKPILLLDTDVGTAAVEDVLTRIEYGVYS